jgi:hypothetical protein
LFLDVNLEPVPDRPALVMKGARSWVCVADLHLGIEVQLRRAGFNIPSQAPKMLADIEELATRGENLLILGDVKHRIPSVSYREDREIPPFLDRLLKHFAEVTIVAGNHDGGLSTVLPQAIRPIAGHGARLDDIGVCHGHVWPSKDAMSGSTLVMGHIHPSVLLRDSLGSKSNEKCWVRGKFRKAMVLRRYGHCPNELVVVPAFNPLLTGTPINAGTGAKLGPIFRNGLVDEKGLAIYLLDGTNLGRIAAVRGAANAF